MRKVSKVKPAVEEWEIYETDVHSRAVNVA